MPLLRGIYGDGCSANLSTLAKDSDDNQDMVQQLVLEPFLR